MALALFLGVSLLFVALARGMFLYGDDVLMFQVTESIVERGTVAVSSPSDTGDVAASRQGRDGRRYAKYGIGLSLVALPAYVVSDVVLEPVLSLREIRDPWGNQRFGTVIYGTSLTNAVVGGAVVALMFLLALACGYRQRTALALALLLAFATLLAHYAAGFLSEPLSALCLTTVVYGLVRAGSDPLSRRRWLLLSGFAAGLALATKVATGVALLAPGLWLLWLVWHWWRAERWRVVRALLAWGLPVAAWLAGVGWYNWTRFGSVTETGYGDEVREFTTPLYEGLAGLLLSPGRGLFWYNPPLLLALAGSLWFARRRPALALTLLGMLVALLLLYGRYYIWWGGGAWGTRFLVPLLPLLLLPAGEVVERAWDGDRRARIAVLGVAEAGVVVTLLALLVPFDRYVTEYSASRELLDLSLWHPGSSPLVVHLRRLDDQLGEVDVAAWRYLSWWLAAVACAAFGAGAALVGHAVRLVLRASGTRRAGRPARSS